MSEKNNEATTVAADPVEQAMAAMRKEAMLLTGKIDAAMLDQIHAVIARTPGAVATATVAAALADVLCALSKTEDGLNRNVLIASEMILKVAAAGLSKKTAAPARGSIIH